MNTSAIAMEVPFAEDVAVSDDTLRVESRCHRSILCRLLKERGARLR